MVRIGGQPLGFGEYRSVIQPSDWTESLYDTKNTWTESFGYLDMDDLTESFNKAA